MATGTRKSMISLTKHSQTRSQTQNLWNTEKEKICEDSGALESTEISESSFVFGANIKKNRVSFFRYSRNPLKKGFQKMQWSFSPLAHTAKHIN